MGVQVESVLRRLRGHKESGVEGATDSERGLLGDVPKVNYFSAVAVRN